MSRMLDSARDYAQNHPISMAAGLIIALPGAYLFITGKSLICAPGLCSDVSPSTHSLVASLTNGLSNYDSQIPLSQRLHLPISRWTDQPAPKFVIQVIRDTRKNFVLVFTYVRERLSVNMRQVFEVLEERWVSHYSTSRMVSVAIATTLPGAFLVFTRKRPKSWAARHQTMIANMLHVFSLVAVANQRLSVQDWLVAAFVVVSFEALKRISHVSETPSAVGAVLSQTQSAATRSDIALSSKHGKLTRTHSSSNPESCTLAAGTKDAEIERLHKRLAELETTEKAREVDLRRTKSELQNARATINETFGEYASLRNEVKTMKSTLGRDHQSIVYRRDIELFALRKTNERKENYIKDREAEQVDVRRQHKAALELKDAELRNLKARLAFLERQESPGFNADVKVDSATESDSQAALQIKFLRVKGRSSTEIDERTIEEKDDEIGKLKSDLADASEALHNSQVELRRAWDATSEVQQALAEERQRHAQTVKEAALKIEEEFKRSSQNSLPERLPTIDEQAKQELEAMFNTAQQDNSRLYGEVEALEKRVREANARAFTSEQAAQALREQLRLEKAINDDMETARPSLVHRVHFQRLEGQLKDSRDELNAKDEEIEKLQKSVAEKDNKVEYLAKQKEASETAHANLEEENLRLKQSITQLESTKEQLMLDHERLARHRARQRTTSAEHTSARSSGATLITEASQTITSDEPLPARPVSIPPDSSIQGTPERHLRSDPNRLSMISNDVPPAELRHTRRKSLTLKGLMRKITRKDDEEPKTDNAAESPRPRTALMPKDKNKLMRPKTAVPSSEAPSKKETGKSNGTIAELSRPQTSAAPSKKLGAPESRYYAGEPDARPKTMAGEGKSSAVEDGQRPKSRGWAASRKLVRKSVV